MEIKQKEFFEIPDVCISRDDLISRFEGRDDFSEKKEEIETLTDNQMQEIAYIDDGWGNGYYGGDFTITCLFKE